MNTFLELVHYLYGNDCQFLIHSHTSAYSAKDVAVVAHAAEGEMAKTLVVQAGMQKWMVVLRSDHQVDERELRHVLEVHGVHYVPEEELERLFPQCEVGAMPPFGNLYGLPVLVDRSLAENDEMVFNACTHTESIRMKFADFERLVNPMIAEFAVPRHVPRETPVEEA